MIQLEQYRDPWMMDSVQKLDAIGFYNREFYVFSNFSAEAIEFNGILYTTCEHAYQALKFIDTAPEIAKQITRAKSPHEAKKIAERNRHLQAENWDDIKLGVMEELLRAKLAQHPYVRKKVLQTKEYSLCEDSPYDSFWGVGPDLDGQNQLGKLWIKLRNELQLQVKSECDMFTQSIIEKSSRFRTWNVATLITHALTAVGYARQNISEAKNHGFWVCGTHMSNVRKHIAMVLLHEYGEEKLAALVDYCKAGCPVENEVAAELMIDLIISHTPHIHLNLGKSIADQYRKDPEGTED